MTVNIRAGQIAAALSFAVLILGVAASGIGHAGIVRMVTGVVEYADKNTITIKNTRHDITGVSVLDKNGETISKKESTFKGNLAVIVYHGENVISVTIFPHTQETVIGHVKENAPLAKVIERQLLDRCFRIDSKLCFD